MFATLTPLHRRNTKRALFAVAFALAALFQVALSLAQGVPQPGTVEWIDDFSSGSPVPGSAVPIENYRDPNGVSYTADAGWKGAGTNQCNGWILNSGTATPGADTGCNTNAGRTGTAANTDIAWNFLKAMATVLGLYQGMSSIDAANNNVLASMTNPPSSGSYTTISATYPVQIQADSVLSVTTGHYYIAKADFAEIHCNNDTYKPVTSPPTVWNDATETISLLDGLALTPLVQSPTIKPCDDAPANFFARTSAGTPVYITTGSTSAWLADGSASSVGIRISNATPQTTGNDVALDNLQIIDVTPQLDEEFSSGSALVGNTVTLTFTITNTDDLLAKDGWSFDEELPTGLNFATSLNFTSTCPSGSYSLSGSILTISGDLGDNMASCTVSVDVTSATPATYINDDASNVTSLSGLLSPSSTSVIFMGPLKGPAPDPVPTGKALPWLLLMLLTATAWYALPKTRRNR